MFKEVKCNLCGFNNYKVLYRKKLFHQGNDGIHNYFITEHNFKTREQIVKCEKCGLVYVNPRKKKLALKSYYEEMVDKLYIEEAAGRGISAEKLLKTLKKYKDRGRLLDVGCAAGFFLNAARKYGWQVYGVELSKWAVKYARDNFALGVFWGTLEEANFSDGCFDAVVMIDLIEHLPDPRATLAEVRRILKPGGVLCISTPNIDSFVTKILKGRWWGIQQAHLYYFSLSTLNAFLKITGFKILKHQFYNRTFTLRYWASRFKDYNWFIYQLLSLLAKLPLLGDRLVCINLGDQIEIFARKGREL